MNHTVVGLFLENSKLLMDMRAGTRNAYPNLLMNPSGHVESGETLEQALGREMKEELGIKVKQSSHLFTLYDFDPSSKTDFRHNFMLIESYEGKIASSREGKLSWMSHDQLEKAKLSPVVRRLVDKLHQEGRI